MELFPGIAPRRHEVAAARPGDDLEPCSSLLYISRRGTTDLSWMLFLSPEGRGSRLHLRLRLGPVKHRRLVEALGGTFDAITVAGLAAGLRERTAG